MTLIATLFSPDGFAVVSDGRRISESGECLSDEARKVFLYEKGGTKLFYGWAGRTSFDTPLCRFDFAEQTAFALSDLLDEERPQTTAALCDWVRVTLHAKLIACLGAAEVCPTGGRSKELIAIGTLGGFLNGVAFQLVLQFCCQNGLLLTPEVLKQEVDPYPFVIVSGPDVSSPEPKTMDDAIKFARRYAETGIKDFGDARGLGGLVQIATITRNGMAWEEDCLKTS